MWFENNTHCAGCDLHTRGIEQLWCNADPAQHSAMVSTTVWIQIHNGQQSTVAGRWTDSENVHTHHSDKYDYLKQYNSCNFSVRQVS